MNGYTWRKDAACLFLSAELLLSKPPYHWTTFAMIHVSLSTTPFNCVSLESSRRPCCSRRIENCSASADRILQTSNNNPRRAEHAHASDCTALRVDPIGPIGQRFTAPKTNSRFTGRRWGTPTRRLSLIERDFNCFSSPRNGIRIGNRGKYSLKYQVNSFMTLTPRRV